MASGARLNPWKVEIATVEPPELPPLEDLTRPPLRPTGEPHPTLPFENLAFEGGGTKGLAYVGAVQVLEESGLYPDHIQRVAGTSSGSFLAAMLAVGCTAEELERLLLDTDLAEVMRDARFGMLSGVVNMVTLFGWNPGARLLDFLGQHLEARTGSRDVTFGQVLDRCGRELCVPVTNLTRMRTEFCHPKTTPDMPVRLAVGMSMSLPVLMVPYRLIRTFGDDNAQADLYSDGGLLCNYPVHAFDGWWLSMEREDSFLQRLRPLAEAAHHLHDAVRFHPRNPRTLGFTVFDQLELDASQQWQLPDGGPPRRPDTTLSRGRHTREEHMARRSRMSEALERALERLLDAMAEVETNGDGKVSRDECAALFASGTLSERDARLLFGTDDLDHIFDVLDHNDDGQISFDELIRFADARNIGLTAHSGLAGREPTSVTNFFSTVFATALQHIRRLSLHPEDRFRTVPINTDYVGTADFELESGDRDFLLQTGRSATRAFLDRAAREASVSEE